MNTPFRVLCIQEPKTADRGLEDAPHPMIGDIDTVIEVHHCLYALERFGNTIGYHSRLFAILPEATADEINEAEKEAIVPAPAIPVTA